MRGMRHILEPYYKLFIEGKEVAIDKLDELRFMARQTELPYEIYEYRKSLMQSPAISPLSIQKMNEASRMRAKGVSVEIIAEELKIQDSYLRKIFIKNNLATV